MTSDNTAISLSNWLGYLTNDEVAILQKYAAALEQQSPVIVNIGAGAGTSGLALREARPDADLYTIDIRKGGPKGGLQSERNAFQRAKKMAPTQILGDSKEVGKEWTLPIDLLFIDGDHSESGIRSDLDLFVPHVRVGGIIAIHDYQSNNWPAVKRVVDEFFGREPHDQTPHDFEKGQTVVFIKEQD